MEETFEITHCYKATPMINTSIPLHFITRKLRENGIFSFEFETKIHLEPEAVEAMVGKGTLIKVLLPKIITPDQKVWLGSDGRIFLSSWGKDPEKDPRKIFLKI